MLERLVSFAWYGESSGSFDFRYILDDWEALGVFDFMLPFLLIFALIFGILSKLKLFGDKSKQINAVIALSVALMSLRFDIVPMFFSDIFPRLGIALAGVLVMLILLGLFGDSKNRGLMNLLLWGSFGVAILIILQSTSYFGFGAGDLFGFIPAWLIPIVVLIILVALVVAPKDKPKKPDVDSIFARALGMKED